MRILIVKTSSMGDVVHALPAVTDMHRALPNLTVDWVVERPFAALPGLHQGVRRVLPMAWRKWRHQLGQRKTWDDIKAFRTELQREPYDLVIDMQGLLKSVMWGLQAHGPMGGFDRKSLREPLAALFYRHTAAVARSQQAVVRCRQLAAQLLGYPLDPQSKPDFGLRDSPLPTSPWLPNRPYAALIPCASRPEKFWPEADWIAVGHALQARGWQPVVLWGSPQEEAMAKRIAAGCDGAVPPFLKVGEMATVLAGSRHIIGLDTGFTHLGAAYGIDTLGIYCDHEPGLAGVTGPGQVSSLGGKGQRPSFEAVMHALQAQWAAAEAVQ